MTRLLRRPAALVGVLFLALHVPFLPPSLEDLDSINFALGIREFDVARHQPHPPGYPLFIASAKIAHAMGLSEVHALSVVNLLSAALAIPALFLLFRHLNRGRSPEWSTWMGVVVAVTCPLYWVTAVRPLSDAAGLAAAVAVQVLTVKASTGRGIALAAFFAALAAGIRSQLVWLTLPLLLLRLWRLRFDLRPREATWILSSYVVGALSWLVPLVVVSGGPLAYWRAFASQGAEDLTGVAMLATSPTARQLAHALYFALIAPWGYWQVGACAVACACAGAWMVARRSQSEVIELLTAFGPYFAFDLLFQEAVTTRYALPLVVPVAYLAVRALSEIPKTVGVGLAVVLVGSSTVLDSRLLYRYGSMEAPAFRMLGDMNAAATSGRVPVLAMHRRLDFDLRRPLAWAGGAVRQPVQRLPSTAKHEWLELVRYWNGGGRDPVWFVADPLRSDLALIRTGRRPLLYRWPFAQTALVGGARPNEVDWYTIEPPDWYLGEGWAITPETAGVSREDRKGPGYGAIRGWVRRNAGRTTILVGGRNLTQGGPAARVRISADQSIIDDVLIPPGFFLRMVEVPSLAGSGDYATIAVESDSKELAVEQFDAQPSGGLIFGFGDGWHELEYDPSTGSLWRWTSDRAVIRVRAFGHAVALTLRGEVEAASSSHLVIRAGDRVVAEFDVGRSFARTVLIPNTALSGLESAITIESSASYVPAESRWRSRDARRLGLKLFECQVVPVS